MLKYLTMFTIQKNANWNDLSYMFWQFAQNTMLKALFLQSNHANEPPEQLLWLSKATIKIRYVFHIKHYYIIILSDIYLITPSKIMHIQSSQQINIYDRLSINHRCFIAVSDTLNLFHCTIQSLWSQNICPTASRLMMDGMCLQQILQGKHKSYRRTKKSHITKV